MDLAQAGSALERQADVGSREVSERHRAEIILLDESLAEFRLGSRETQGGPKQIDVFVVDKRRIRH